MSFGGYTGVSTPRGIINPLYVFCALTRMNWSSMSWYSFLGLTSHPTERLVFSDPKLDMRIRIVENGLYALVAELTVMQRRLDLLDRQRLGLVDPMSRTSAEIKGPVI